MSTAVIFNCLVILIILFSIPIPKPLLSIFLIFYQRQHACGWPASTHAVWRQMMWKWSSSSELLLPAAIVIVPLLRLIEFSLNGHALVSQQQCWSAVSVVSSSLQARYCLSVKRRSKHVERNTQACWRRSHARCPGQMANRANYSN